MSGDNQCIKTMNDLKYPIGVQNFEKLRTEGYLYVDKTDFIRRLVNNGSYYFLGRPRRFGKSLLLSTLEAFFQGKRHLFTGLAIDADSDWDWQEYPVIHIDLNAKDYTRPDSLEQRIGVQLDSYERKYDVTSLDETLEGRFMAVIQQAYERTGRPVVVLIDEYDKPILDIIHDENAANMHRDTLRAFYSVLKSADRYLKFCFLSGITKFGQLNIFSGLNNLRDISFDDEYSAICGITEDELHSYLYGGVSRCADKWQMTLDETLGLIKTNYDGYHFSPFSADIYNPWSLINCLSERFIREYWNASGGSSSFLHKLITNNRIEISDLNGYLCTADILYGPSVNIASPVAVLYQCGYLTLKSYDMHTRRFTLGYPNQEVANGFLTGMLADYTHTTKEQSVFNIDKFVRDIERGDCDAFLTRINTFFADFPYENILDVEQHFQNVMYCILKLMGMQVNIERHTSNGRIDMTITTDRYVYIIEFKRDGTPGEALKQIEEKGYALPFACDARRVIRAGVVFSTAERRISEWKII